MPGESVTIAVPDSEIPRFRMLVELDECLLHQLGDALAKQPPSLDLETVVDNVAKEMGADHDRLESILSLLWRWATVQRTMEAPIEDFIKGITVSLNHLSEKEWNSDHRSRWDAVSRELARLLSSDCVAISTKAAELILSQNLVLYSSRIITDMRPVLDDSAAEIKTIVPFHNLVLTCKEGRESRELYIALDSSDITKLRKQLERAEQKERLFRSAFSAAGFPVISIGK